MIRDTVEKIVELAHTGKTDFTSADMIDMDEVESLVKNAIVQQLLQRDDIIMAKNTDIGVDFQPDIAKRPAGISGSVTYGNRLKALVCVLNTKGMVAMKNLSEIIQGLTRLKPSVGTVSNMLHSAAVKAKMIVDGFQQ